MGQMVLAVLVELLAATVAMVVAGKMVLML